MNFVQVAITATLRLVFAALMTYGTYLVHSSSWPGIGYNGEREDFFNFRGGFLISATTLFTVSILLESIWFRSKSVGLAPYVFHLCGNAILIAATTLMKEIPTMDFLDYITFTEKYPDIYEGCWIAGGILTGGIQIYFSCESGGNKMRMVASGLGALGSLLFCFGGVIGLDVITDDFREMHDYTKIDVNDLIAMLWISGSITYILHSIVFIFALKQAITAQEPETNTETDIDPDKERTVPIKKVDEEFNDEDLEA
jgi:hypothetical protein